MVSKGDEIRAKLSAMSPSQRRLLLQSIPATPRRQESIPRHRGIEKLPQSYSQRRLWYLYKLDPDSSMYNMPQAAIFHGRLNYPYLQKAYDCVLKRHSSLRTVFADEDGIPVQRIAAELSQKFEFVDLSHENSTEVEGLGRALSQQIADRSFDLVNGPVVKMTIIKLGEEHHLLVVNMHHIVSDGWSVSIFVRDFLAFYRSLVEQLPPELPHLPIAFSDFVLWQNDRLSGDFLDQQLSFWKDQLACLQPLALPFDRAPSIHTAASSDYERMVLTPELRDRLASVAKDRDCTLFMALLAAFKVVLHRYSGQTDINVGVPVAGRNRIETENLIGYFTNTTLVRTDLGDTPSFADLLLRVRESSLAAFAHDEVPLEKLADVIQPDRDLSRNPLFQVMFILQNTAKTVIRIPSVETELLNTYNSTVKFDMLVEFYETADGINGGIGYRTGLFDRGTMVQFVRAMKEVINFVADEPEARISDIPMTAARQFEIDAFSEKLE
jgi:hypothetical protein